MVMLSQRNAVLLMLLACFVTGCAASRPKLSEFRQISTTDPGPWPVQVIPDGLYKHRYAIGRYQSSHLGPMAPYVKRQANELLLVNSTRVIQKRTFNLERADGLISQVEYGNERSDYAIDIGRDALDFAGSPRTVGEVTQDGITLAGFDFEIMKQFKFEVNGRITFDSSVAAIQVRQADETFVDSLLFGTENYIDFTLDGKCIAYIRLSSEGKFVWVDGELPENTRISVLAAMICLLEQLTVSQ